MHRTTELHPRIAAPLVGAAVLFAWPALAAPPGIGPRDKGVLRLDEEALGKDYLDTSFLKAEKKLERAITMCGKKGCSPGVLARLHRDLGVVRIGGLGKIDAGKAEFSAALAIDKDIALDRDYATPAMKKAFDEARGVKEDTGPKEPALAHIPVTDQAITTPIPVFATFQGKGQAKLRVWYKGVKASRWASVGMSAREGGFGGEIPCNATASEGEVQYFVEATTPEGETLARDGSRTEPHRVTIRKELDGPAPILPDSAPPARCTGVEVCDGGECPAKPVSKVRANWFSFSVEQDLAIVGAGVSVCSEQVQVDGAYSCFRARGSQYHGSPLPGKEDNVGGGLSPATTRIHIGYDRVLVEGLTLGVRLGYALRGGGPRADGATTRAFLPYHAEARLSYWFGSEVFSTAGFRPFVFACGGAAQVDAAFDVAVREDPTRPPPPNQTDNPPSQTLRAYRRMGQGFVGGGLGLMYAITPGFGFVVGAKYMHLLPTAGNVIAPEGGLSLGF